MNNDTIKTSICNYLKEGMTKKDASVMAGISEASFYRWIEEDESFKSRVEANILEYKHTLVRNVTTCAEKDGRLALEVLKRRYPQEWGNNEYVGRSHEELETERKNVRELLEKILVQEEESVIPV